MRKWAFKTQSTYFSGTISLVITVLNLLSIPVIQYSNALRISGSHKETYFTILVSGMTLQYVLQSFYIAEIAFKMYALGPIRFFRVSPWIFSFWEIVFQITFWISSSKYII